MVKRVDVLSVPVSTGQAELVERAPTRAPFTLARPAASVPGAGPSATAPAAPAEPTAWSALSRVAGDLDGQREAIDRAVLDARRGRCFSPADLLVLQAQVYAYSQGMEVVSRLVDKTVSAVKTALGTQV